MKITEYTRRAQARACRLPHRSRRVFDLEVIESVGESVSVSARSSSRDCRIARGRGWPLTENFRLLGRCRRPGYVSSSHSPVISGGYLISRRQIHMHGQVTCDVSSRLAGWRAQTLDVFDTNNRGDNSPPPSPRLFGVTERPLMRHTHTCFRQSSLAHLFFTGRADPRGLLLSSVLHLISRAH